MSDYGADDISVDALQILDGLPALVSLLTPMGGIEMINSQILAYTGRTREQLEQWTMSDLVHGDDLGAAAGALEAGLAAGVPFDIRYRMRRHDGVFRWFEGHHSPIRDQSGRIARWGVVANDVDDRQRAQDELREAAQSWRSVIDGIPGFAATLAPDGTLEAVNRQIIDYAGADLDVLRNGGSNGIVHPEDLPKLTELLFDSIAAGQPFAIEHRVRRRDGEYRWFHNRTTPAFEPDGRVTRWYVLLTDIDDRKRAEEALARSERSLQLTIDTVPALIWSADPEGRATYFNRHYLDYVGRPSSQLEGWDWASAVHPDDLPGLLAVWEQALASRAGRDFEGRLRAADGEYRWFLLRAVPVLDADGAIVKWYGVNTDIEDRKRAEAELRRSEASLADAQRVSATGSFAWDLETDGIEFSGELRRIFGFNADQPLTLAAIGARIHPDDLPLLTEKVRVARTGVGLAHDIRLRLPGGEIRYLHAASHPPRPADGTTVMLGTVQDITQRRVAEQALEQLRAELAHVSRVHTLGQMTASIAHEVNQPLAGILTNANTCLRLLALDPADITGAQETARRTIRDGVRASEVVTRLRALFQKESTAEPMHLNDAVRDIVALSAGELQKNWVSLEVDLADNLPPIMGDRVQLQQVILNLLLNAADAVSEVQDRPRRIVVTTRCNGDGHVELTVQDTGAGFTPESREKLFDAFYTTKATGMGIGLSVSRSIIAHHSGRIWAVDNAGPGASLAFSLPPMPGVRPGNQPGGPENA